MKTVRSIFGIVAFLCISNSGFATVVQLENKSPVELIELWEVSSRSDQAIIQDMLFENYQGAINPLRHKVLYGSKNEKLFSCKMIAEMRDLKSAEVLIEAVADPDEEVKVSAVSALMKLKAKQAAPVIRSQIPKTNNNKALLKVSLAALGTLSNPQDIAHFRPFLSDPDGSVQVNAAVGMALLGDFEGQDILLNSTYSPDPRIKKEATYSLGFINTPEAKVRLKEVLADPEGQWKSYAKIAIIQQQLLDKPSVQQLTTLELTVNDKNPRVAEWAVDKIIDINVPQAMDILRKIEHNNTHAGRKAKRMLKIRETQ